MFRGYLSHSTLAMFRACPTRYAWAKASRLKLDRREDVLRLGDAVHQGLDVLKLDGGLDEAVAQVWRLYADLPGWADPERWFRDAIVAVRLVQGWHSFFGESGGLRVLASEEHWQVSLRNPKSGYPSKSWGLRGIWDGVVQLDDGRVMLLEHKTTGQNLDETYHARLMVDSQVSIYMLAAREMGLHVDGVLYDVIRKPTIKQRKIHKKERAELEADGTYHGIEPIWEIENVPERESFELYGIRVAEEVVANPERFYRRFEVPVPDQRLESEAVDLWMLQQDVSTALRRGRWPRNTQACTSPFQCAFLDLCSSGLRPEELQPGEVPAGYVRTETNKEASS